MPNAIRICPSLKFALILAACAALAACSNAAYYWQSASGHLAMLNAAAPVPQVLDSAAPEALKTKLALSQRIRDFASQELRLPDNASYRRYADLQRSAVVWNVVATPEFSLELNTWCFAVVGCVSYRGFFSQADAELEAAGLRAQGLEVSVYGVPAYSTLGRLNWLGAYVSDPLLNTFIHYPEGDLARLIFHELAHQVEFVDGDTVFNESFATAVERIGGELWMAKNATEEVRQAAAGALEKRSAFRALTLRARTALAEVYKQNSAAAQLKPAALATKTIAEQKAEVFSQMRRDYAQLKQSWGGFAGYDPWMDKANNASLAVQAAYDSLVPGFAAVFEAEGRDWGRFYDAVKRIGALPKAQRHAALGAAPPISSTQPN